MTLKNAPAPVSQVEAEPNIESRPQKKFDIRDRLWITAKSRMVAEVRLNRYDLASHLILSYYALTNILAAIFSDALATHVTYFNEITIVVAVVTFAASLIVYGFKFEHTAALHRDCYLRLDELRTMGLKNEEIEKRYHALLAGNPNHSERDYETLVIERTFFKNQDMWNVSGQVKWNYWMLLRRFCRVSIFYLAVLILLAAPTLVIMLPIFGIYF